MKRIQILTVMVFVLSALLSACGQGDAKVTPTPETGSPSMGMPVPGAEVTEMVVEPEEPVATPEPSGGASMGMPLPGAEVTEMVVENDLPETYRDAGAGFELDYPTGWMMEGSTVIGSRGSQGTLSSWAHTPGDIVTARPAGSTLVTLTVYQWEPKNDLAAYLTQRKMAWEGSGLVELNEETVELAGGQTAQFLTFETVEKTQVLFVLTTVGEAYLQIAGEGDLALVSQMARTLRIDR